MKSPANAIEVDANTMRDVDKCIKLVQEKIRGQLYTTTHRDEVIGIFLYKKYLKICVSKLKMHRLSV